MQRVNRGENNDVMFSLVLIYKEELNRTFDNRKWFKQSVSSLQFQNKKGGSLNVYVSTIQPFFLTLFLCITYT